MGIGPMIRAMGHNRMRFVLIILEVAITLAIVTNCLSIILSERKNMAIRSGFADDELLFVTNEPYSDAWKDTARADGLVRADLLALKSIPGVKNAAATYFLPWQGGGSSGTMTADGYAAKFLAQVYPTSPEIFDTLGAKLIAGRGFVPTDTPADPNASSTVTIISDALAKKLWGGANPLGKVIANGEGKNPRTVIGVIGEFYNPYAWKIEQLVLFTPGRSYGASGSTYLIRVEPGARKSVTAAVVPRLLQVDARRVFRTFQIPEVKQNYFINSRLAVGGLTAMIVVLVFVTSLGVLGISAMSVAERTKQVGTRRALGATRGDILRHFLVENWLVTTAGLLLGIAGAYAVNILLVSHVSDMKLQWPLLAAGMLVLWINGLLSTIPAAVRAMSVPPSIATRSV